MEITAEKFKESVGEEAIQDDLERCNCKRAGEIGHTCCGWDSKRDMPVFIPGESKAQQVPNTKLRCGPQGPSNECNEWP